MTTSNNDPRTAVDRRRQLQRQRQPQHQAAQRRRLKRQRKEARAKEADDYATGKLLSGDSTPLSAEDINSFWDGQDRDRFANLVVDHLRECRSSGTIDGVGRTINRVMKALTEHQQVSEHRSLTPEELGQLTEDELAMRLQRLVQVSG